MIIFHIINAFIPSIIALLVYKEDKKLFIPTFLILEFVSFPNYNCLCVLFLFLLMKYEREEKGDYLIGLLIGLCFLSKLSIGVLLALPSLIYIKQFRKILKRILGFLIPNFIFILYFYLNGSLSSYIDYAFLGLFDFAESNVTVSWLVAIVIVSIIFLIMKYFKTKDKELLYIICFQIVAYPIFNVIHVLYALVPVIYYFFKSLPKKIDIIYSKYYKFLAILLICPLISNIMILETKDLNYTDTGTFKYRLIEQKRIDDAENIKKNVGDEVSNAIFIMYEAYMNKLILGIDIGMYDMLNEGNMGYDGVNKMIEKFDNMEPGTKFITYREFEQGQASEKIYRHVTEYYTYIKSFGKYQLYER